MAAIFQYTYGSSGGLFLTHLFVISHFLEKVFIESSQFGQTLKRMSWWDLKFDFSKNSFSDQNIIFESKIVIFIISNHCFLNFGSNSSEKSNFRVKISIFDSFFFEVFESLSYLLFIFLCSSKCNSGCDSDFHIENYFLLIADLKKFYCV